LIGRKFYEVDKERAFPAAFALFSFCSLHFLFIRFFFYLQYLNQPGAMFCTKLTEDDNAITNSVEIAQSSRYAKQILVLGSAVAHIHLNIRAQGRFADVSYF
jgi:hypothetical protein